MGALLQNHPAATTAAPLPARLLMLREAGAGLRLARADRLPVSATADLLTRLARLIGRPLRFHHTCAPETSFDEAWLMALFGALERNDAASYRFNLRSRLTPAQASEVHFLVCKARVALDIPARKRSS